MKPGDIDAMMARTRDITREQLVKKGWFAGAKDRMAEAAVKAAAYDDFYQNWREGTSDEPPDDPDIALLKRLAE